MNIIYYIITIFLLVITFITLYKNQYTKNMELPLFLIFLSITIIDLLFKKQKTILSYTFIASVFYLIIYISKKIIKDESKKGGV